MTTYPKLSFSKRDLSPGIQAVLLTAFSGFVYVACTLLFQDFAAPLMALAIQAAVAVWVVRHTDRKAPLCDLRFIYIGLYALYNGFYPISILCGGPKVGFYEGAATATWLGCTGLLGMSAALLLCPLKTSSKVFVAWVPMSRPWLLTFSTIIFVAAFTLFLNRSGVGATSLEDRRANVDLVYSQTFVVSGYLLGGFLAISILLLDSLSRLHRVLVSTAVIYYAYTLLYFGFRLQVLLLFVSGLMYLATKPRIAKLLPAVALIGFIAMLSIGFLREAAGGPSNTLLVALTANTEFSYPMQTLSFYLTHNHPLQLGSTYLHVPLLFIPRSFYPNKGLDLAQQFLVDAFHTTSFMGFTFTPNTEAFLNFGYLGPILVHFAAWLSLSLSLKSRTTLPVWFICLSVLGGEINRSEFSGLCYALVLTIAGAYAVLALGGTHMTGQRWTLRFFTRPAACIDPQKQIHAQPC